MVRSRTQLEAFTSWLTAFGDAWEAGDADAAAALFTVGATLQATPFADLLRSRREIREYFKELFVSRFDSSFAAQILGAGDTYGVAHWSAAWGKVVRDGVLVAALDGRGRCTSLRQWWHESVEES